MMAVFISTLNTSILCYLKMFHNSLCCKFLLRASVCVQKDQANEITAPKQNKTKQNKTKQNLLLYTCCGKSPLVDVSTFQCS